MKKKICLVDTSNTPMSFTSFSEGYVRYVNTIAMNPEHGVPKDLNLRRDNAVRLIDSNVTIEPYNLCDGQSIRWSSTLLTGNG